MKFQMQMLAVAFLSAACSHTSTSSLPPPPGPNAPLAVRQAYYDDHRVIAVRKDPGDAYAILGSGLRVDDPHALLPALEANSASAQAVERADDAKTSQKLWSTGIAVTAGLGYATMLSALLFAPTDAVPATDDEIAASFAVVTIGTVVALGSLAFLPFAVQANTDELKEKDTAFVAYDRGLRRTLGLDERAAVVSNGDVLYELRPSTPTPLPAPTSPPAR